MKKRNNIESSCNACFLNLFTFTYFLHHFLKMYGCTLNEFLILAAASQGGEFSYQKNMFKIFDISSSLLSNILRTMKDNCLIETSVNPHDKRDNVISLTKKGEYVLSWLYMIIMKYERVMLADISETELEAYAIITRKMLENLLRAPQRTLEKMPPFCDNMVNDMQIPQILDGKDQMRFLNMLKKISNLIVY